MSCPERNSDGERCVRTESVPHCVHWPAGGGVNRQTKLPPKPKAKPKK